MIDRLRLLPGFAVLDDDVLEVIAARATPRSFAPGQLVLAAGDLAETLLVCLDGRLVAAGGEVAPPLFDAPGMLFGLAVDDDYRAGPEGLEAIAIAKPHLFTLAREFPDFIVALMDDAEARA